MELAGVRAIAFDFDGVIVDSMPVHWACWREALESVLGSGADRVRDRIRRNLFGGRAGPGMFEGIDVPAEARQALRTVKDALWEARAAAVPLMPSGAEALASLAVRLPLAVATTARRDFVNAVLSREALAHVFAAIVTNADVPRPKPAPDMLERIARVLGVPARQNAMVGDTAFDRRMAEAAGAPFLWFGTSDLARPAEGDGFPVVADWSTLARVFGEAAAPE
jgi:AHBA synthesis associated protein